MPNLTLAYNAYNQVVQAAHTLNGTEQYAYDPSGQRVWKQRPDGTQEVHFYAPGGARLSSYTVSLSTSALRFTSPVHNLYFAGRLIWSSESGINSVISDRLDTSVLTNGSSRKAHFPYGELRQGTAYQFATYRRDVTGLDYAVNRYYSSQIMRFTSPDPSGSADPALPQSWNQYAYVQGDPVNGNDPTGLRRVMDEPYDPWGFSVFGGFGSSNLPGGFADASWGYGSYMSATGGITNPNMLATVTAASVAANHTPTGLTTTTTTTTTVTKRQATEVSSTFAGQTDVVRTPEVLTVTKTTTTTVTLPSLPLTSVPLPRLPSPIGDPAQLKPPSRPADPAQIVPPKASPVPSGKYTNFLTCELGIAAAQFHTLAEVFVGSAVAIAAKPTPWMQGITLVGWGTTLYNLVRRPCVEQVYGPGRF